MAVSEAINPRNTAQYREGRDAFYRGEVDYECPYDQSSPHRVSWLTGWYDVLTEQRHANLFRRWRIVWP